VQVAEQRGVYAFGQASDMSSSRPRPICTAILDVWDSYYVKRTRAVLEGTWKTSNVWHGFKEGMVQMSPYNERLPAEVKAAEKVRRASSTARCTRSPARSTDQSGAERVAAGETMTDEALLSMDWYVEGVSA
jgi:basic membrane protein A and related proteins